jgi:hypothetical protein
VHRFDISILQRLGDSHSELRRLVDRGLCGVQRNMVD